MTFGDGFGTAVFAVLGMTLFSIIFRSWSAHVSYSWCAVLAIAVTLAVLVINNVTDDVRIYGMAWTAGYTPTLFVGYALLNKYVWVRHSDQKSEPTDISDPPPPQPPTTYSGSDDWPRQP